MRGLNADEVFSDLCHSARRDEVGNEVKGSKRGLFFYIVSHYVAEERRKSLSDYNSSNVYI